MKQIVMIVFAAIIADVGFAKVFPNTDGSNDISSAAAWGGAMPTDTATFSADGTFTASADCTFADFMVNNGAKVVFDLKNQSDRTISSSKHFSFGNAATDVEFLTGTWAAATNLSISSSASNLSVVFSNATVSCSKTAMLGSNNRLVFTGNDTRLTTTYTGTYSIFDGKDSEMYFTDGAKWQSDNNHLYLTIGSAASNNVLRVDKGARFTTTKNFFVGYNANEGQNRLEIGEDGYVKANVVTIQRNNNELVISNGTLETTRFLTLIGSGCRFAMKGAKARYNFTFTDQSFPLFGNAAVGARLEVLDGAEWTFNTANIYTIANNASGVTNSLFRIANGGTFSTDKNLFIGYSSSERSNRVEVANGGRLNVELITINREGQSLDIDNGEVNCNYWKFGSSSKNCRVTLAGSNSRFVQRNMQNEAFSSGNVSNSVVVSDGAIWHYEKVDKGYYTAIQSSKFDQVPSYGCRFVLNNNGTLLADGGFLFGYDEDYNNRLEVLAGSMIKAPSIRMGGIDNEAVVSNSTIMATNGTVYAGLSWGDNNARLRLTIAGTNSQITATNDFILDRTATLHFAVPAEGFVVAPISVNGNFTVQPDTHITVDADAFQNCLSRRARVTLATWGNSYNINAGVLSEVNNALAEKKMSISVEDKKLVLSVRALDSGTILIVK